MKKIQCLTIACLFAGAIASFAQTPAKAAGDAKKGKATFDESCGLCHATTAEQKMGPGLQGLFKKAKLATTGKVPSDGTVTEKIDAGGNGMPAFKDMLSAADKANVIAYLKTL